MQTCENCGANAVNSRGICQNCGWRQPGISDSSPSLGETRAAEVPTTQTGMRGAGPSSPFGPTADLPRYTPPLALPSRGSAASLVSPQGGTSRYCGTCGARIERGEVFCGQCGTPVGSGRNSYGGQGMTSSAPSRYMTGDDEEAWSPANSSEFTEAILPSPPPAMPAQYNRGVPGLPYNQAYGSGTVYAASPGSGANRSARIVWGVVCLVASLVIAGAAVLVAVH